MNTWRSVSIQFGTPIVLLVCLIVAMHQRDRTFTAAVEAQNLAVKFKRVAMDSTLQTSDAIDALRICQSNFSAYLATHQAPAWPMDLPSSGVFTNSPDIYTVGEYNPTEPSTWELLVNENNEIIIYGQLIGRIVNCKFIPFVP